MSTTSVRVFVLGVLALMRALLAACGTAATLTPLPTMTPLATITRPRTEVMVMLITSTPDPNATANATATYCATNACPTNTLYEDQMRATEIIEGATGTTVARQTLTSEAQMTHTLLSPDQLTATQVIAWATATAAVMQTATSYALTPTPVLDYDQMRATQIIVGATATVEAVQTGTQRAIEAYTPPPTLTSDELQRLRELWLDELETAAGFSHPVFEEVVDGLVQTAPDAYAGYLSDFHMQPEIEQTDYEGSTYVALIVEPEFIFAGSRRLLLFRLTDEVPVLLPDVLNTRFYYYITFSGVRFGHEGDLGGFADRNGNGYPDLAIDTDSGGSCGVQAMQVLEIRPDDQVMNLSPITMQHMGDSAPRDFVDLEGDGILEIVVATYGVAPISYGCHNPAMMQYYGWNGESYENISPTLDESYYPAIDEYWSSIDSADVCLLPDQPMYQMLIDYMALGRLEEGWMRLQRVLHWERCPGDLTDFQRDQMLSLVAWVGWHLPTATPTP